jgi:cysteine desulfurase / selenocysteine lyase
MRDINEIRKDFPVINKLINGKPIVYLDSTATSLKPQSVLDDMNEYYNRYSANVFRGIYKISEEATAKYEESRRLISKFIGSPSINEIIFTRNTSESLNLVCATWAINNITSADEIVTTILEHHSNFVPWQQLSLTSGCKLKIWNVGKDGLMNIADLEKLITRKTKLFAITSMSNVYGTIINIEEVVQIVKRINPACVILVDAAQSVPHLPVNVKNWGADFVAFSGHKMLGPTGIGVLWGRSELLEAMPPYQYGGDMISEVHLNQTFWNHIPHKFEAGTPNIAGSIGLGSAVKYLNKIGMGIIRQHEIEITSYALKQLQGIKGIRILGPRNAVDKGGVISFTLSGIHPHDIAQILDEDNICIRVGFHCAQPLHEFVGCGPTARASFYLYTTKSDIDALIMGLEKVISIFK